MSGSDSTLATMVHFETVLERVLLAIINAHLTDAADASNMKRLDVAMTALVGLSRPHAARIEKAVLFMEQQRQRDICNIELSALAAGSGIHTTLPRSVPYLAQLAARDILGITCPAEVRATANMLCREYRSRATRHSVEYDPAREAMQDGAVRRILDELADWDVPGAHPK
ncbi:hypothetical protein [Pararhizobium gei]|uniref:hypothetical protein n=1 Tax=Pararhizobium gei TaxID=1395951 RepID=UPI0023D9E2C8|nr:hypothetical protein [Rhizobium gei]